LKLVHTQYVYPRFPKDGFLRKAPEVKLRERNHRYPKDVQSKIVYKLCFAPEVKLRERKRTVLGITCPL